MRPSTFRASRALRRLWGSEKVKCEMQGEGHLEDLWSLVSLVSFNTDIEYGRS